MVWCNCNKFLDDADSDRDGASATNALNGALDRELSFSLLIRYVGSRKRPPDPRSRQ